MKTNKLKILIVTGIYPPRIGGPAQYAKETREEFVRMGNSVKVLTFRTERYLPTGLRHFWFFIKVLFNLNNADFILALDTFSVGFPAVLAGKIFRNKVIIRTGGDFLWEGYVERTGDLVLFRNFYKTRVDKLNLKEKIIFKLTRWILRNSSAVIFSTKWQKGIFMPAYDLYTEKCHIVENFYGEKLPSFPSPKKDFVAAARPLKWKNADKLKAAFEKAKVVDPDIELDLKGAPYEEFLKKIQNCYAVVVASIGDISPNMILDAIRCNKPFILTKENGITERVRDFALFIDPENIDDIAEKLLYLTGEKNYENLKAKIQAFNFGHSWKEICHEILDIYQKIK